MIMERNCSLALGGHAEQQRRGEEQLGSKATAFSNNGSVCSILLLKPKQQVYGLVKSLLSLCRCTYASFTKIRVVP